ncbi:hypothetical protein [Faecalibacillus intestinalis]|uniref:hypothetical protein n=1 Tax=Faecalibacillus intestinalis TaxID=1982626 RepID=UPI003FEF0983
MVTKNQNIIEKYLNTKSKKIAAGCVAGVLLIGGVYYVTRDTSPDLSLKKEVVTVEYGQTYNPVFDQLVKTKGLDKDDVKYLKNNVKIKNGIKNEDQKGYPAVGKYKVTVKYKDETKTVKVTVKDTTAPELNVPDNTEVVKGTDLSTFDFKSLMSATDLAQLNEIQIDYSSIDINTAGEYTAKASVEDINKNKTEKEFKVTVVEPSTDENTETTTEVQTDPTTGQKKTVVVSKPKNNTTTSNRNSSSNSSNKSNTSGSTSNSNGGSHSTGSSSSKPSSGGNTGGSSSGPSQPSKVLKTTYWYECYVCGKHVESTVSLSDAKNKFNNTPCTDEYEGFNIRHPSYHYGFSQHWE